jgi:hypothetical protein
MDYIGPIWEIIVNSDLDYVWVKAFFICINDPDLRTGTILKKDVVNYFNILDQNMKLGGCGKGSQLF